MSIPATPSRAPFPWLLRAGQLWFLTACAGQLAFIWFILAHYWRLTLTGHFAGWNDKPLIKGYVAGDSAGNAMFAAHVLLAAVMTLGGLLQLWPALRKRWPGLHRWNGRLFVALAVALALGGLWLVWVRHTWLSMPATVPLTLNALLILAFSALAVGHARARRLTEHRRWALRLFMVANGVWLLRVAMMAWVILGGRSTLSQDMSGPVDLALQFGCYLIPLAVLELYLRAQEHGSASRQRRVALLVMAMTAIMAVGIAGTVAFMWGPYMI
jgi:hypothetical protein